jgi:hypothetical protein
MSRLVLASIVGPLALSLSGPVATPLALSSQAGDTLVLTSANPSDSVLRLVLPSFSELKASFEMRTRWLNVYSDSLVELAVPTTIVLSNQALDIRLQARAEGSALRLAFNYSDPVTSRRTSCVAVGSTLRVSRGAGEARSHVTPDRTLECRTR